MNVHRASGQGTDAPKTLVDVQVAAQPQIGLADVAVRVAPPATLVLQINPGETTIAARAAAIQR